MSKKEAVLLVSRALALYLICWTFSELTYVPPLLFSLSHHMSQHSVLAAGDYLSDLDVLSLGLRVFRIITLFGVAIWLYTCGSSAQAYFWRNSSAADGALPADRETNPPTAQG